MFGRPPFQKQQGEEGGGGGTALLRSPGMPKANSVATVLGPGRALMQSRSGRGFRFSLFPSLSFFLSVSSPVVSEFD